MVLVHHEPSIFKEILYLNVYELLHNNKRERYRSGTTYFHEFPMENRLIGLLEFL